MATAKALFLNASSYPNQTKLHSISRRRIIIPTTTPQISLPKIILTTAGFITTTTRCSSSKIIPAKQITSDFITTTQITTGFITTTKRSSSSSSSSSRASTFFRVQCFKEEGEGGEKERKPNQNPFETFFAKALKHLPVYQIISIVVLMVLRSPIVIGLFLGLDLCLVISSFSPRSLEKNGGTVVLDIGVVLGLILFFPVMFALVYYRVRHPKRKSTVIKFQVGLSGLTPSLQNDLVGIRNWSNIIPDLFDSVVDRWIILPVIASSLASHLDYCTFVYSSVDVKPSVKDGEEQLNKLLIEERQKFVEKTPANEIDTKRQCSTTSKRADGFTNEYTVITILLAAIGVHELPAINDIADLKEALQKLGSISCAENMAVEVLWTQNENGTLPERELLEHYPLLRPLYNISQSRKC